MDEREPPTTSVSPRMLSYRAAKEDSPRISVVQSIAGAAMTGFAFLASAVCALGGVAVVLTAWGVIWSSFALWAWELWKDPEHRGLAIGIWIALGTLVLTGVLVLMRP